MVLVESLKTIVNIDWSSKRITQSKGNIACGVIIVRIIIECRWNTGSIIADVDLLTCRSREDKSKAQTDTDCT
jgi:hypothetical protein